MFNLPVFVGIDYHTNTIQVCVMDQQRKILANQSVVPDEAEMEALLLRLRLWAYGQVMGFGGKNVTDRLQDKRREAAELLHEVENIRITEPQS